MILDRNQICSILTELYPIYNDLIITGSCSDMFNIGYTDIEDIDLIVDKKSFEYNQNINDKAKLVYSLTSKIDGHILNRYIYQGVVLDLLIKDFNSLNIDCIDININNITIKNCSIKSRYDQLVKNNYKKSHTNYDKKIKKVEERISAYKKILFDDSRNES